MTHADKLQAAFSELQSEFERVRLNAEEMSTLKPAHSAAQRELAKIRKELAEMRSANEVATERAERASSEVSQAKRESDRSRSLLEGALLFVMSRPRLYSVLICYLDGGVLCLSLALISEISISRSRANLSHARSFSVWSSHLPSQLSRDTAAVGVTAKRVPACL